MDKIFQNIWSDIGIGTYYYLFFCIELLIHSDLDVFIKHITKVGVNIDIILGFKVVCRRPTFKENIKSVL